MGVDASIGSQSPEWVCDAAGNPMPQPLAVVRGLNTFVSLYEFTIDPAPGAVAYEVAASGNLVAATQWLTVGSPTPTDCSDPTNPMPGSITYAPFPTAPETFECALMVNCVPSPGAGMLAAAGALLAGRRRRG